MTAAREAEQARAAGEAAERQRRDHYAQQVLGQGSQAGDPQPSAPTLIPPEPPPPLRERRRQS